MRTDRIVRDGMVAVLVSPGYGAGWSTWGLAADRERMLFCPRLVRALESGAPEADLAIIAREEFPEAYLAGIRQVVVEWVREGKPIRVVEYDGAEHVESALDDVVTP